MAKTRILIQLDPDQHASSFDAVVAIDAGVEKLLQYASVSPDAVPGLVHGGIFTRGPADLHSTAIFVGGSQLQLGEKIVEAIQKTFFGPMRLSVMLDSSGANTTAAAAVLCACRHIEGSKARVSVLGATGPVGQRVCRLLAAQGSYVSVVSRERSKAVACCQNLTQCGIDSKRLMPVALTETDVLNASLANSDAVVACGAAGVQLISLDQLAKAERLKVAIDLNAVAPSGIPGIEPFDDGTLRFQRFDYGAIGVGGLKMKIHKAAIRLLFTRNDLYLDAEQILEIGKSIL